MQKRKLLVGFTLGLGQVSIIYATTPQTPEYRYINNPDGADDPILSTDGNGIPFPSITTLVAAEYYGSQDPNTNAVTQQVTPGLSIQANMYGQGAGGAASLTWYKFVSDGVTPVIFDMYGTSITSNPGGFGESNQTELAVYDTQGNFIADNKGATAPSTGDSNISSTVPPGASNPPNNYRQPLDPTKPVYTLEGNNWFSTNNQGLANLAFVANPQSNPLWSATPGANWNQYNLLPAGTYFLAVAGYSTAFSGDPTDAAALNGGGDSYYFPNVNSSTPFGSADFNAQSGTYELNVRVAGDFDQNGSIGINDLRLLRLQVAQFVPTAGIPNAGFTNSNPTLAWVGLPNNPSNPAADLQRFDLTGNSRIDSNDIAAWGRYTGQSTILNLTWDNKPNASDPLNPGTAGDGATWDLETSQNFNDTAGPDVYFDDDNVTFNDTNNSHYAVTLNSTVSPGSLTFNNSSGNYTISGTGSIAETTGLAKSGTGSLTLATNNTYTGTTTISAGTLQIGSGGAVGTLGTGTVTNNGTLIFDRTGTYIAANAIGGSGNLIFNGSGSITLSGSNSYAGTTAINAGTVSATNAHSLGNAATNTVTVAAGAALNYRAAADAQLAIGGALGLTSGTGTTIGGSIGSTSTSAEINVAGNATTTAGAVKVNLYGVPGTTPAAGTYTLVHGGGAGSSLNNATYSIGTVLDDTGFAVGTISDTASSLQISISTTGITPLSSAYWTGGFSGGTNVWDYSDGTAHSNWVTAPSGGATGLVPGAAANVVISASSPSLAPTATILGGNMAIKTLTISDTTNGLGLVADGNSLTITPTSSTTGITMNASVPASNIGATLVLGASQTWTNNSASALTISGAVSGASANSLTTAGPGKVILTAANTYAGATTISSGTLQIGDGTTGHDGSIAGASIVDNAALVYDLYGNQTYAGAITGSGTVSKITGTGTLTLIGPNSYFGATTISTGTLQLGDGTTGHDGSISGASIVNNSALVYDLFGSGTYSGVISSSGTLTMSGTGTLTLAGANTFSGNTTVSSGTLNLANTLALQNSILLTGGVTFDSSVASHAFTVGGLTGSGTITLSDNAAIPNPVTLSVGNNNIDTSFGGNLTGPGNLTKIGSGTLTLTGTNTFTGNTTITNGVIDLTSQYALENSTLTATTGGISFSYNDNGSDDYNLGGLSGSGNVSLLDNNPSGSNSVNLTVGNNNANTTYSGILSGTIYSTLTKIGTGTFTLTGANSYSGQTTVSAGVLTLTDTGTLGTAANELFTVSAGAVAHINGIFTSTPYVTAAGSAGVGSTITFGVNDLNNNPTIATTTPILVRTVKTLTIGSGSTVSLDPANTHANRTLLVASALTFSDATQGTLNLSNNDLIIHNGNNGSVTTAGSVSSQLKAGFNAAAGYWNGPSGITSTGTTSAASDTHHLTTLGYRTGGITFDGVSTVSTDILVKYTYYGDANLDGVVNGADYQQIDQGYGTHLTGWSNGDFNYDGVVDGSDFSLIDNTFNQITATGATSLAIIASPTAISSVPEPIMSGLLGVGALGLLGRHRRHSR